MTDANLVTHGRHVFASDLAALKFADEQTNGLVFSQDEDEGVQNATVFDLCTWDVLVHVLDDLSLGAIYLAFEFVQQRKLAGN